MLKNCKKWLKAAVFAALLGIAPEMYAQAVIFPQVEQPGVALAEKQGEVFTIKNNLLTATFEKVGGKLTFKGCPELNLLGCDEIFHIELGDGSVSVPASQMTLGAVTVEDLVAEPNAATGSFRIPGKEIKANYTYKANGADLSIVWHAILRDGSHYIRTKMDITANADTKMYSMVPMDFPIDNTKFENMPKVVGNTRGAIVMNDKIFAGLESPMGFNTVKAEGVAMDLADFDPKGWNDNSFKWKPEAETPQDILAHGSYNVPGTPLNNSEVVCARGYVKFYEAGPQTVTFQYVSGGHRLNLVGVDVLDASGKVVSSDYHAGFTGGQKDKNVYNINVPTADSYQVRYFVEIRTESVLSSGTVTYSKKIAPVKVFFDGKLNKSALTSQKMSRALSANTIGENETVTDAWKPGDWTNYEQEKAPQALYDKGWKGNNLQYIDRKLTIGAAGELNILFSYAKGIHRLDIAGVYLLDDKGAEVTADSHTGFTGTPSKDNLYKIKVPNAGNFTLRYYVGKDNNDSEGNISISLPKAYEMHLPAPSTSNLQCLWRRNVVLKAQNTWNVSAVAGLVAPGQERRSVLCYVERERAVPWRAYPIYNSWYELNIDRNNDRNYDGNMHDYQCEEITKEWQKQLYGAYGVGIKAFVWDDGWDNYGTWTFNKNFPHGFDEMDRLAKQMDSGIGAWLGPVGGYGTSGNYRREYWNGKGGMQLSNPAYYKVFKDACDDLLNKRGYDFRFFKFDGISSLWSATGPANDANGDENAEAIIYAELDMRTLKSDVFFNTSVGTWASPFWFRITDAVWRQENDFGKIGNNKSDREQWITYRDRLVYQNFVQNSPMCPINDLMTHGFILTKFGAVSKDMNYDGIVREMRCAFACGSAMVELYNDFKLMNSIKDNNGKAGALWGDLAECIEWQEKNAAVLPDVHWVGGNPWNGSKHEVYGWAAWNGKNATLALRNGANEAQTFKTTLREALEIPAYVAQGTTITLNKAFDNQKDLEGFAAGQPISIDQELTLNLPGSSVYVFDNTPAIVKPSYVVKNVSEINNRTAYTLKSVNRGYLTFSKAQGLDANYLSASFGNGAIVDAVPAENEAAHQFAFVRTEKTPAGQYFMYSMGAQKFVSPEGVKMHLTDEPVAAVTVNPVAQGADNNQFVIKFGNQSVNLTNWQAFQGTKVTATDPDDGNKMTVTAVNHKAGLANAQEKIDNFYKYNKLDRKGWTVTADSNHPDGKGCKPENVLDGNLGTFWHNNYGGGTGSGNFPYNMVFDLKTAQTFNSFGYVPRQDSDNGRVKDYILSVSADGANWKVVKSGSMKVDARNLCWVDLNKTVNAQYVKLTMTSNQAGNSWACMSEFYLAYDGVSEVSPEVTGYPVFSTPGAAEWYYINFKTGGANLKDMGDNKKLQTAAKAKADDQKWVLIGNEYGFKLKSAAGRYITFKESRFQGTSDVAKSSDFVLIKHQKDNNYWELQQVGSSLCMNQFGGAGKDKELGEWNANDNNNPLSFKPVKLPEPDNMPVFCETTETVDPSWYFIQFKNGMNVIADQGEGQSARMATPEPVNGQLWKLVGNKAKFQFVNKDGRYLVVSDDQETNTGAGPNANPLRAAKTAYEPGFSLVATQNETYGPAWEIHANDAKFSGKNFNQHGGAGSGKTIGQWNADDANNPVIFVAEADMTYADFKSFGIEGYTPEHDLSLWYTMPATVAPLFNHDAWYSNWMEYSLPIGDGQFGGSLFGGLRKDEILFNEKTLWSGSPTEYGKYEVFGSVFAEYLGDDLGYTQSMGAKDYVRELDLTTAKGKVSFSSPSGVKYTREYIASHPARVIAARYTADQNGKINLRFTLESSKKGVNAATSYIKGDATYGEATFNGSLKTVKYDARIKVVKIGDAGTLETTDQGIEVRNADEVLLVLAGGTDYDPTSETYVSSTIDLAGDIQKRVNDAAAAKWENLYQQHLADFQHFFNRVDFQLTGTQNTIPTNEMVDTYNKGNGANALMLEKLYFAYGRYLEIASSRGVDLPSNLQGIWCNNEKPAWNCDIHANINVQMNYWPAEPTNLSEMHLPFLNYISRMANSAQWKKNAIDSKQTEGWTCFTENNIFGGGGGFMHEYVIANAWYCTHLWQHYRYTLDKAYLKEVFPAMWSASRFWAERLKLAADGSYECPNEYSPEHGPTQDGVAHAQQLVWDLFDNTLKAIEVLGKEVPSELVTTEKLADLQNKFAHLDKGLATEEYNGNWGDAIPTGSKLLREWKYSPYTAGANGHRHMSHLMCLYPFSQVEPGTELYNAAVNSLKLRGDGATGWSMGWKINLWARAQDGNHARTILSNALAHANTSSGVYYNLFDAHNPFQIDGNFGACSGIAEMIMQSNEGIIRILPALPTAWKEGYMKGLKAVGNFTVDVAWQGGKAVSAKIVSHMGSKLLVHHQDINAAVVLVNGAVVTPVAVEGKTNIVEIPNVKAGDVVTINFDQTKGTLDINTKEGFGTVYADHAFVMPQGVKGSTVTGVTEGADGVGTLNTPWEYTEGTTVPAHTALVLNGAPGKYIYNVSTSTVAAENGVNYLKGTLTNEMTENVPGTRYYMLTYSMEGTPAVKILGFFRGVADGSAFMNAAGKAYLAVPTTVAAQVRGFRLTDEVTGIEDTVVAEEGAAAIYNLAGVRMNVEYNQLPKGVYIVNGKKVIIK